jgi:hypothetical protein
MGVWIHVPIIKVKLTESRLLNDALSMGFYFVNPKAVDPAAEKEHDYASPSLGEVYQTRSALCKP